MFKWFKKKEAPKEICIPKIFEDNAIIFSYQHSIEIATIPITRRRKVENIKKLIDSLDEKALKKVSRRDLNKDAAKIYQLIGSNENERILIGILDPVNRDQEPELISFVQFENEPKQDKKLELAS